MRRIQIVKKLFFKLSDFERVRSHVLQFYESSALQRNGNNDNLVLSLFLSQRYFHTDNNALSQLWPHLSYGVRLYIIVCSLSTHVFCEGKVVRTFSIDNRSPLLCPECYLLFASISQIGYTW
jgi:hypothetical protein